MIDTDEYDTDREVSGILYRVTQVYPDTPEGKELARIECYFERTMNNKFARPMRVLGGPSKGKWGAYVSTLRRDD